MLRRFGNRASLHLNNLNTYAEDASAKRLQEELLVLKGELRGLIDKDEAVWQFADQMMDFTAERQCDEAMPMRDALRASYCR